MHLPKLPFGILLFVKSEAKNCKLVTKAAHIPSEKQTQINFSARWISITVADVS